MRPARAGDVLRQIRDLPFADLDSFAPGTVLILAPHPDDETLGCGGMIATACARGRPPVVVVLTDGTGSHSGSPSYPPARLRALREAEARTATALLGLPPDRLHFLGLPDTRAPHCGPAFEGAMRAVAGLARESGAGTLCTTWQHDPHGDHVAAHLIGAAAAREVGAALLTYPVWGWTLPPDQVLPVMDIVGARLDIAAHLARKRSAIAAHESQCSDLISDDPGGFRLADEMLANFQRPFEVFLQGTRAHPC